MSLRDFKDNKEVSVMSESEIWAKLESLSRELQLIAESNRLIYNYLERMMKPQIIAEGTDAAGDKTECPDVSDSGRYPSGRAAELLGISRDTLRKHTDNGLIRCVFNRGNKRRMYEGKEMKRYWRAYC